MKQKSPCGSEVETLSGCLEDSKTKRLNRLSPRAMGPVGKFIEFIAESADLVLLLKEYNMSKIF